MKPVHSAYTLSETFEFPGAITLKVLLSGSQTNGTLAIFEDIVQPGVGPPRHIHPDQDETFFFLEGNFMVEIDGQLHDVSAGDVAFIPRGMVHAFKNAGATPGRLRYIFSPALQAEDMFRAFHAAHQSTGMDKESMERIALQYGQQFVGPPL